MVAAARVRRQRFILLKHRPSGDPLAACLTVAPIPGTLPPLRRVAEWTSSDRAQLPSPARVQRRAGMSNEGWSCGFTGQSASGGGEVGVHLSLYIRILD